MSKLTEFKNDFLGEKYTKIDHPSGLTVYVFPKDRMTSWAILGTEYGAVDNYFYSEEDGKFIKVPAGIAHFLEHKMFDNEDGTNIDDLFSRLGADPNAYTAWEETGYFFNCNDNFYEALSLLIKFVTTPYFTEESIAKEQGIIGQEIAMCEDDPYDRCYLNMMKGLYERTPVRLDIVGSQNSIAKITPELLYKCHKTFYDPSNMVLVVCGKVDAIKIIETVSKELKGFDGKENKKIKRKYPIERKSVCKQRVEGRMHIERPMFCIGFKDSDAPTDSISRRRRQITAELVAGTLFSASGKLYSDLFKRGVMTTAFNYGEEYGKCYSFCYVTGECDSPDTLVSEIEEYIEKLKIEGIDKTDFERRRKMIYSSDIKLYDSTWDIASAVFDNAFWGIDIFTDAKTVEEITLEEANELLRSLFKKDRMTVSVMYPNEDEL